MKYPYSFEVLTNGKLVMRLPQEIKLMETFLGVEVSAFGDWILEEIHSVLNGKESKKKCCYSISFSNGIIIYCGTNFYLKSRLLDFFYFIIVNK